MKELRRHEITYEPGYRFTCEQDGNSLPVVHSMDKNAVIEKATELWDDNFAIGQMMASEEWFAVKLNVQIGECK